MKITREKNLSTPDILFSVARDAGGSLVYAGSSDAGVQAWDLDAEKPVRQDFAEKRHTSYVTGVVARPDQLISGAYDGTLCWWDLDAKTVQRSISAHSKWIRRIALSPDRSLVASVADDMVGKLWNAETGELVRTFEGHAQQTPHHYPSMLYALAWSPDGQYLATVDKTGIILVWQVATGELAGKLEAPVMYTWDPRARRHSIGGIRSVCFSPDGKLLVVGGMGKVGNIDHLEGHARVEIFDWQQGTRLHEIESTKFKGLVEKIEFHPHENWCLVVGGDHKGFLMGINTATGELFLEDGHDTHIHDFLLDHERQQLVTVGHNRLSTWSWSS